ncbi:MAG: hypothetical protein OIF54_06140, partial [Cohaesibacter sp.]|nr:hypothetical protein [Cohaesibacter sp.]
MVGLQWSSKLKGNLSKYGSIQNSGTSSMAQYGKWATTRDGTLFGPEVRSHFPAESTLVLDTYC